MAKIILICGLPGSGKSTLAHELATILKLPLFSKDRLEASVVESGLATVDNLNGVGYFLLKNLIDECEKTQQTVIVDFVADKNRVLQFWPSLVSKEVIPIECVCSDTNEHRRRIETRNRNISGWYELTWSDVELAINKYIPLFAERLTLDSLESIEFNTKLALDYVLLRM
ncbi:AAA family ATPase [Celerinatantimonas yamalensis]|uniref:AAA family ATPase n=1 Tax=Celerinatantimonas yamalensis TaxID=559956 RepID=A0ABW9G348_9GAMM